MKMKRMLPKLVHNNRVSRTILAAMSLVIIGLIGWRFSGMQEQNGTEETSVLMRMLGGSSTSAGYDHGDVLSIDGEKIAEDYTNSQNGWTKYCALPGFNGILGSAGSGGALTDWQDVLHASDDPVNRAMRCGNTIQTTLSYQGQVTAAALLGRNCPATICDDAAIAVVLRDGAVLVAAGSNWCEQADYFDDGAIKKVHDNYAMTSYPVGSVVKGAMARVLLQNDSQLGSVWSLYNNQFEDVSSYTATDGTTIRNYDYRASGQYDTAANGILTRRVGLAGALAHSSNTYFLRHMLQLGGAEQAYETVGNFYRLFTPVETECGTLDAVTCASDRLLYWFWGQDFSCSPVRLCQIYNHALSGEAYIPFFVSAVYLPDHTAIYRSNPQSCEDLNYALDETNDILRDGLAQCFASYKINKSITEPYQSLLDSHRLLTKSGTADTDMTAGKTNAVRVLTVLDAKQQVTATACVVLHNVRPGGVNSNLLYRMLFQTLDAAGVIEPDR